MSHRCSASKSSMLLDGCAYPFRGDVALPDEATSDAAAQGNELHDLAERFVTGRIAPGSGTFTLPRPSPAVAARWEHLRPWLDGWLAETAGAVRLVEAGYCYDVLADTVREVPREQGRDYGNAAHEMPGRLDLAAIWPDRAQVVDLKTGRVAPDAETSGQLRTLGLMLERRYGVGSIDARIAHVTDNGVFASPPVHLEPWDLDAHAERLRAAVLAIPTAQPTPGEHCVSEFCRLRETCPARLAQLATAIRPEEPDLAMIIERGIQTPDDVARAWPMYQRLKSALDLVKSRMEAVVKGRGDDGGVPLPDGRRIVVATTGGGESISLRRVKETLGEDLVQRLRDSGAITERRPGTYLKEVAGRKERRR